MLFYNAFLWSHIGVQWLILWSQMLLFFLHLRFLCYFIASPDQMLKMMRYTSRFFWNIRNFHAIPMLCYDQSLSSLIICSALWHHHSITRPIIQLPKISWMLHLLIGAFWANLCMLHFPELTIIRVPKIIGHHYIFQKAGVVLYVDEGQDLREVLILWKLRDRRLGYDHQWWEVFLDLFWHFWVWWGLLDQVMDLMPQRFYLYR